MSEESRKYEIAFLLADPESEKNVTDLISQHSGLVVQKSELKYIKLGFPIRKNTSAYFGFLHFQSNPEDLVSLSQSLRLNQLILRFLIIALPAVAVSGARSREKRKYIKPEAAPKSAVTNEALEEKLEEILK